MTLMITIKNREPRVKVGQNTMFSVCDKAFYLNRRLWPVAYPHNVLPNPGSRRQMRLRHSCALENREVDKKTAAGRQAQQTVLGPVKKARG
jgi:hypothetical protein